jgi:uncharacterized protein YdhG (YjbR/CyaY superfamily)
MEFSEQRPLAVFAYGIRQKKTVHLSIRQKKSFIRLSVKKNRLSVYPSEEIVHPSIRQKESSIRLSVKKNRPSVYPSKRIVHPSIRPNR